MAATSHPLATLAALDMLRAGGNAMDAAITACAVQGVVEPGSTGIGGDCFALFAPRGTDRITAFNGSGRAPAAISIDALAASGQKELPRHSPHTVTVPGAVDAWDQLLRAHGTKTLGDVLAPAIRLAADGYPILPRVHLDWSQHEAVLAQYPKTREVFLPGGAVPALGSVHRQPDLARTLERIARDGRDAFYRSDITQDIVEHLRSLGGVHTVADFEAAAGEFVTPIRGRYRGHDVFECPPNGQGVIALLMLHILEGFRADGAPVGAERLHLEIEAARLAYSIRNAYLADPAQADVPVDWLLSDTFAAELRAQIRPDRAMDAVPSFEPPAHRDTVYIAVVDAQRNAVSLINSIFSPFGSGIVTPRSGVLLHNRGQSFSLQAGHPNAIAPRKRPMHTIIPGMLARDGRAVMPFGVMGGHYQAMGQACFLGRVLDYGLDLQTAMDLPRVFVRPGTRVVEAESTLSPEAAAGLRQRGFELVPPAWPIGGSQAIWIDHDAGVLAGGSDPRKDGCALGY
ncbi:MAG: gamma-glutamyltransferase family protein [Burkholderiales bacterium]|nr:gamma-glutamyltransferase family protein [Burkholderiales bacterium]